MIHRIVAMLGAYFTALYNSLHNCSSHAELDRLLGQGWELGVIISLPTLFTFIAIYAIIRTIEGRHQR